MLGIQNVITSIKNLFTVELRTPATALPAIIMACSLVKRPGLSCLLSTNNVLQNISKKGLPIDKLPDGSPNLMNALVHSIICEVVRTIKEDANLQTVIEPGALTITATGGNAGGPVTVVGTNTNYIKGMGVVQ